MKPQTVLIIYLAFFIADFFLDWILDILNLNESLRNRGSIPERFRGIIKKKTYRKSVDYTQRKGRFGLLLGMQDRILLLAVLFTGAAGLLDGLCKSWDLPAYWHGFLFLAIAMTVENLVKLPSALYSQFVIEEEFGFNTTTFKTLILDSLKGLVLWAILLAALLGGLYLAMSLAGAFWWLIAWGFWVLFQLVMAVLYPVLIAPLFNKFEPLPEGDLKNRLSALADRCGFANKGIFVMDGSRRSRHSNAYFTGIGKSRRIVIYDTLISALEDDELEAVLAHEIGHWKHGHIRTGLFVSFGAGLAMFAVIGYALHWIPLFTAFGFAEPSLHAMLFWLTFFSGPISFPLSPLVNMHSRRHEYQADRFARENTSGSEPMRRALLALGRDNLSNLTPHRAYSFWHYSHPSLSERLAALSDEENPNGKTAEAAGGESHVSENEEGRS